MSLTTSSDPAPISDKNWVKVGSSIYSWRLRVESLSSFKLLLLFITYEITSNDDMVYHRTRVRLFIYFNFFFLLNSLRRSLFAQSVWLRNQSALVIFLRNQKLTAFAFCSDCETCRQRENSQKNAVSFSSFSQSSQTG